MAAYLNFIGLFSHWFTTILREITFYILLICNRKYTLSESNATLSKSFYQLGNVFNEHIKYATPQTYLQNVKEVVVEAI